MDLSCAVVLISLMFAQVFMFISSLIIDETKRRWNVMSPVCDWVGGNSKQQLRPLSTLRRHHRNMYQYFFFTCYLQWEEVET